MHLLHLPARRAGHLRAMLACLFVAVGLAAVPGVASATTCTPTLTDSAGFSWDLTSDGEVSDGFSQSLDDAFDGYSYLSWTVGGTGDSYPSAPADSCTTEDNGREIVYPTAHTTSGLDVARKVFVPETGLAFARWLDIVSNPTGAPIVLDDLTYHGELGSDSDTKVRATSSGDLLVALPDAWFVTDESLFGSPSDPTVGHVIDSVLAKADAVDSYIGPADGNDSVGAVYNNVTVPAGATLIYLHSAVMRGTADTATATSDTTLLSRGVEELYAGLTDAERAALRNFPAQGDGDVDGVVNRTDNCPSVANADQANTDGDAQGDACDADDDNDGFSDDVETLIGTDPKKADTDGDGVADKGDACPTRSGSAANQGCPGDDAPPTVNFGVPTNGQKIPATGLTLTATATDATGIKTVVFIDDSRVVCTDTTAPYTCDYKPTGDDVGKNTLAVVAVDTADQTAVDLRTTTVDRFTPGKLSASVSPGTDRTAPFTFRTRGTLSLPTGVTKAQACTDGVVSIQVKAASKTISTRRVDIKKDCTYSSTVSFRDRSRFTKSGVLKATARFTGNDVLSRGSAVSKTFRTK